jgi:poly(A) polymerase
MSTDRQARIIARSDHPISRKDIDPDTLRVLYKLKDAKYESYLVGGAVRDLLMGRRPKDFDVATDARPSELRRLFRNSRIVGRRFRLVHVFFGHKNVEVATLRSAAEVAEDGADLYVEDDNQWGDLESDAFRRDFTINALFYDIRDFAIIDYTGGVQDLEDRVVRAIGEARVRFQEDPVRMLRAIKFAARFGFEIEADTADAIAELHSEILKASRFRVTEEIFRILTQANREEGLQLLAEYGLLRDLYPEWLDAIGKEGLAQVREFFAAVDQAAGEDRFYPLEILSAGLFLPLLDSIDIGSDQYHAVAARVAGEVRSLGLAMDLPKRLILAAMELLRGQLYLLFFHHLPKRMRRFVESEWYDPTWQLHELAFGRMEELASVRALWVNARKEIRRPMGGTVESPDRRDIFSFRGKTGGGRHQGGGAGGGGGGRGRRGERDDDGDAERLAGAAEQGGAWEEDAGAGLPAALEQGDAAAGDHDAPF